MAKYEYDICNVEDEGIFYKQCSALEKNIPKLEKLPLIMADVLYQRYLLDGNQIGVWCDFYNGVHIKSDIPLEPFFEKK